MAYFCDERFELVNAGSRARRKYSTQCTTIRCRQHHQRESVFVTEITILSVGGVLYFILIRFFPSRRFRESASVVFKRPYIARRESFSKAPSTALYILLHLVQQRAGWKGVSLRECLSGSVSQKKYNESSNIIHQAAPPP